LHVIARYINEIRVRSNKTVKEYTEKLMQSIKKLIEDIDINEDRLFKK